MMNISQQKVRLVEYKNIAMRRKFILKKNKRKKNIKWDWRFKLKILSKLKISTIIIKNIGRKSKKLYNKSSLMKLTFFWRSFYNIAITMQMFLLVYQQVSKITWSEWIWNKAYMHSCSWSVVTVRRSLKKIKIKIKMKINSSSRFGLKYHSISLVLILIKLKKKSAHVKLISIKKYFKDMMKYKTRIHLKCL